MANEHLTTLYEDVFEKVYPQIESDKNGVLYKVIHILEAEESEADEICTNLGIKNDASLEEDQDMINSLISQPLFSNPFDDNGLQKILRNVINPDKAKIAWIVIIACILVGAAVCFQYVNNRKQKPRGNAIKVPLDSSSSQPLPPVTAALCLVVPASVIIDLKDKHPNGLTDNSLGTSDLKMLIDNASYFLCKTVEEAKPKEEFLEIANNEDILPNSNREVYIRIHIDNGQEMIDKESPYILKRNLPPHGKRIVKRYDCLKNLSGLENFNRV